MVRDSQLKLIKGPGRADDKIVFSVAEKPLSKLEPILSFMPSGLPDSLIKLIYQRI